ncbi:hypothetical protein B0H34DRAFT_816271, partial [Crassisporium funariophilum]
GSFDRFAGTKLKSRFVHLKNKSRGLLEEIAHGAGMFVVYVCAEMLKTPTFANLLHSESFKAQLSGIYLDKAYTLHESQHWRPVYACLHLLWQIAGLSDMPMIVLSAMLPSVYRQSLLSCVGLKPNYYLIHKGNFCAELSVIIKFMQFDIILFNDLVFIFPLNGNPASIPQTIIYSDNIERITKAFWWCKAGMEAWGILDMGFVDLLHAGLSTSHQESCTRDFMSGAISILFATDKVGAGMDFPNVKWAVQYCCRDLSLVQWEQRRGRSARTTGNSAVGILLVEKSMASVKTGPSLAAPGSKDPGLVDDICSNTTCYEMMTNKWLENPGLSIPCSTHCSHCNPSLLNNIRTFTWMPVTNLAPAVAAPAVTGLTPPSEAQQAIAIDKLKAWRLNLWTHKWKNKWFSYGADHLICDADIKALAKTIHSIKTTDCIYKKAHIPHFTAIAPPLLQKIQAIKLELYPDLASDTSHPNLPVQNLAPAIPSTVTKPAPYPSICWANDIPLLPLPALHIHNSNCSKVDIFYYHSTALLCFTFIN